MIAKTYTAVRNGHFFVKKGTWEQLQKILDCGYCVCRSFGPDCDGDVMLTLGIVIPNPEKSRHVYNNYNLEFQGARPAKAGEDY